MIQVFAPRMPRGFSRVWPAVMVIASWSELARAQAPAATEPAKGPAAVESPVAEVFVDPAAKKSLTVFNSLNYTGSTIRVGVPNDDRATVQNMAGKVRNPDPALLKRFVEFFAIELTKRDNLNAVINPPANQKEGEAARGLERAVNALTKPLSDARAEQNQNTQFLTLYNRILFESTLVKLLDSNHNYYTRIDAMIVLGMAGSTDPVALELYSKQLKNPDQLIWVKLWACRGLSIAADNGRVDLDAARSNEAAEAVVSFLDSDPMLPWPAQMRALEALGSLRVATVNNARGKVDAASVAMKYLNDRESRPEVRAWAAWALGMMKVPPSVAPYNYQLIGLGIGDIATRLGTRIVEQYDVKGANFDRDKDLATHLTALLLFQVYPSIIGEEGARDSGLLRSTHPSASAVKPFLVKLDDLVKSVTRESYELLRAGGAGNKERRDALAAKVTGLKAFLSESSPKDYHLLPGGPEFKPVPAQQVAGATPGR